MKKTIASVSLLLLSVVASAQNMTTTSTTRKIDNVENTDYNKWSLELE